MLVSSSKLNTHISMHLSNLNSDNSIKNCLKKNDPLKDLMDQKQKILENKKNYLDNALKNNNDPESTKQQMSEFDNQIKEIDKQISELKIEEQKKSLGNEDKDKKTKENNTNQLQNNSETNKSDYMMTDLVSISSNMSQAKTLSNIRTSAKGEKRILEDEIKTDEGRGLNPTRKRERVSELNSRIKETEKNIGDKYNKLISNDSNTDSQNVRSNDNISKNNNSVHLNSSNVDSRNNTAEKIKDKYESDSRRVENIKIYRENAPENNIANGKNINFVS